MSFPQSSQQLLDNIACHVRQAHAHPLMSHYQLFFDPVPGDELACAAAVALVHYAVHGTVPTQKPRS